MSRGDEGEKRQCVLQPKNETVPQQLDMLSLCCNMSSLCCNTKTRLQHARVTATKRETPTKKETPTKRVTASETKYCNEFGAAERDVRHCNTLQRTPQHPQQRTATTLALPKEMCDMRTACGMGIVSCSPPAFCQFAREHVRSCETVGVGGCRS